MSKQKVEATRVIVAGSRTIQDYWYVAGIMENYWNSRGPYEVVSGMAKGVDTIAADFGYQMGLQIVHEFPVKRADWERYGKRAGYLRNEKMARFADALLCIWDGKSKGAKMMIDIAREHSLDVTIVEAPKNV